MFDKSKIQEQLKEYKQKAEEMMKMHFIYLGASQALEALLTEPEPPEEENEST